MRNDRLSEKITDLAQKLPYFKIENLKLAGGNSHNIRVFLARQTKAGNFIRLKKGIYTTRYFVEKAKSENKYSDFLESLSIEIYSPAYLSLEYVLYQNNILTEFPVNFTLMSKNKTADFNNRLGNFIYHKIKNNLFLGFNLARRGEFMIYKATKAKALFDFLYLRKNLLINSETIKELRLNLEEMDSRDKKELKEYVYLEGSLKMKKIYDELRID